MKHPPPLSHPLSCFSLTSPGRPRPDRIWGARQLPPLDTARPGQAPLGPLTLRFTPRSHFRPLLTFIFAFLSLFFPSPPQNRHPGAVPPEAPASAQSQPPRPPPSPPPSRGRPWAPQTGVSRSPFPGAGPARSRRVSGRTRPRPPAAKAAPARRSPAPGSLRGQPPPLPAQRLPAHPPHGAPMAAAAARLS